MGHLYHNRSDVNVNAHEDIFEKIAAHKGVKDETYFAALNYTQATTRQEGIDSALIYQAEDGAQIELDALILSDRRLVGQQIAAQAGR